MRTWGIVGVAALVGCGGAVQTLDATERADASGVSVYTPTRDGEALVPPAKDVADDGTGGDAGGPPEATAADAATEAARDAARRCCPCVGCCYVEPDGATDPFCGD